MGMFDKVGSDAKREQQIKREIQELQSKLLTVGADEAEDIKAEIVKRKLMLSASGN